MSFVLYPAICAAAAGIILVAARLLKLRYSLRSLAIFILLAGCCEALYINWAPWRCEAVLEGHEGAVSMARFSPDGRRLVTASDDRTARIWDPLAVKSILVFRHHTEPVCSAAFSPDGEKIVTASLDGTVRVWSSVSGKELVVSRRPSVPLSASFSPCGNRIVVAGAGSILDSTNGTELVAFPGYGSSVYSAEFSLDGTRVVTTGERDSVRVWDSLTGKEVLSLSYDIHCVGSASFSPDGRRIVAASTNITAQVWDLSNGKKLAVLGDPHYFFQWNCSFSPDGNKIVTASPGGTAQVWDSFSGKLLAVLKGHEGAVSAAVFSRDGQRIATASDDKTARIWRRTRPEWWWGVFYMLEFWFSAGFAAALVWSLLADRRTFARMDAEAARGLSRRSQ